MPLPNARSSCCATGWPGTRTATVSWPPVMARSTAGARRSTSVSGPGQNFSASAIGGRRHRERPALERPRMLDVDDQRMRGRPALQLEDLADGVGIRRVGAESVDRFGRERDDLAFAQRLDRLVDLVLGKSRGHHAANDSRKPSVLAQATALREWPCRSQPPSAVRRSS